MLLAFASTTDLDVALTFGLVAGIFLFFKGFRVYREYRVLADTPEEPIRSIPMGLVHIHGKATGEQLVTSPVTKTPCYFYKVDIEKYVRDKNSGHWAHAKTDNTGVPFYLDDGTGKVLVDAHDAEYDLIQSGKRETGSAFPRGFGRLLSGMDNPTAAGSPVATDNELVAYVESLGPRGGGSLSDSIKDLALGGGLSLSGGLNSNLGGGSYGRYRLTEYCILPDHWYDVTGTCIENPKPKDEQDRNMILKGQNEPTFLISWRSEKEIEGTLRNRAALYVFGGGTLSLGCLAALLVRFGWF